MRMPRPSSASSRRRDGEFAQSPRRVGARHRAEEGALPISRPVLLDAGADVNLAAVNGITPLMAAAFAGQDEIVKRLLAQGANPAASRPPAENGDGLRRR
jgi:ankyrin repeat protein